MVCSRYQEAAATAGTKVVMSEHHAQHRDGLATWQLLHMSAQCCFGVSHGCASQAAEWWAVVQPSLLDSPLYGLQGHAMRASNALKAAHTSADRSASSVVVVLPCPLKSMANTRYLQRQCAQPQHMFGTASADCCLRLLRCSGMNTLRLMQCRAAVLLSTTPSSTVAGF
jgi:hypothetical protein